MIVCPSCNARNANRSVFCIRCGVQLTSPAERDPGGHTDALPIQREHTPAGLIDLAATQLAEGRPQQAVENCRRAIALSPGEVEAHAILGMAYEQQGELAAALEAYETVVALAPQRNAERQKAALLQLRLGDHPEPVRHASRPAGPVLAPILDRVRTLVQANPPLYAGIASGLLIFLVGTLIIVSANRAQARRALDAKYVEQVQLGDQALAEQRYADASVYYNQAWQIKPGDDVMRQRWNQAYQLSLQNAPPSQIAQQLPKYIPNLTGRNPFDPVPIGGTQPGAATMPPAPQMAVPPPTMAETRPPMAYETVREPARQLPQTTGTGTSGRRQLPSPMSNGQIITPVVGSTNTKPAAGTAPPPQPEAPLKERKGEITIWVSDKPVSRPAAESRPSSSPNPAESLRSRGEQAASAGRTDEAIQYLGQAASAFEDRARQDPSSASTSSRAAASCRARIEVLRKGQ